MNEQRKIFGIDTFTLKWIAILSMLIDHVGYAFFPNQIWMRVIGRLAFPIFAYLIVEGFYYTRDVRAYMCRIGVLALLSEIPFDLLICGAVVDFRRQNVCLTLFLGMVLMYFFTKATRTAECVFWVVLIVFVADFLRTDYGDLGVLMILCFYLFREKKLWRDLSVAAINIVLMGFLQAFATLALIPISFHNGMQGRRMKWFFWAVYPVHLVVLFVIRMLV